VKLILKLESSSIEVCLTGKRGKLLMSDKRPKRILKPHRILPAKRNLESKRELPAKKEKSD
jgi:hypothetical protein